MRFNKYWPFAFIFFFINTVGLPIGLTYTTLLGPLFYVWILLKRKKEVFLPFFTVFAPFIIVQVFISGVELPDYIRSFFNILMIYIFCQAVFTFFTGDTDYQLVFRRILILNGILCLVALALYFTPLAEWVWIKQNISKGIDQFMRLKMFTYEASYYAQLFVPVFLFFLFQYFLGLNTINNTLLIFLILMPMVLSFSLGVLACLLIALLVTLVIHTRSLLRKKRVVNTLITVTAFVCFVSLIMIFFFRDNALFLRLENVLAGQDSSGQGRTSDAFYLALKILKEKNETWGIGPGQLKFVGQDIIRSYYLYYQQTPVAIPNVTAETLMVFGWAGIVLKFFLELFLFFQSRVWNNYFRLSLFLFMFTYQFTGSFLTNVVEYVIWIMAFTPVFREFDVSKALHRRPALSVEHIQS